MTEQQRGKGEREADKDLDSTGKDSFPASDPPSHSAVTGVGRKDDGAGQTDDNDRPAPHERDDDSRPTGLPTSDRHAQETAHHWEDQKTS